MYNFFALTPLKKRFNIINLSIVAGIIFFFSSCNTTYYQSYYLKSLKKDTTLANLIASNVESKIKKDDFLSIKISSLNSEEDKLFNGESNAINGGADASGRSNIASGKFVDNNGNIEMHKIGAVHVEGLTLKQVEDKLEKDLSPYLKDIIVEAGFINHRITVLGEVNRSQQIQLDKSEKISILDALAMSGDATMNADKSNVMVIRDSGDAKQVKIINLEDHAFLTTSWFYLKPDDILYVPPDTKTFNQGQRIQRRQLLLSTLTVSATLIVLVLDRVIR